MAFNRPGKAEHLSLLNYVEGYKPVYEPESEYIYCKEDLITLRPGREHAWLDRSIEKFLRFAHCRPLGVRILLKSDSRSLLIFIVGFLHKGIAL
jgi:hypothetical protein